eukprot:SAG31_NODE_45750_length_257_cov_0.987342_1_plen_32_part_01
MLLRVKLIIGAAACLLADPTFCFLAGVDGLDD